MEVKFRRAFGGIGKAYYELLKSNQIVIAEHYQQQLIDLNRALNQKRPIAQRKCKMILLHAWYVAKVVKERHFSGIVFNAESVSGTSVGSYSTDIPSDHKIIF